MRGLPFQIRPSEIIYFFSDYSLIPSSVHIGKNKEGRRTGFGSLLFTSEEECRRALNDKQGGHMGNRYIELYLISLGEYHEQRMQVATTQSEVRLQKYVTQTNKQRVILVRGLPFKIQTEELQEFFKDVEALMKPDIVIESSSQGKRTGQALVFFSSEEKAKQAKEQKNMKTIGPRYVEIFDAQDLVMQQVCGIQGKEQAEKTE